jgi:putative ATPase
LLSRSRVYVLRRHEPDELLRILRHALEDTEHGLGYSPAAMSDEQLMLLVQAADGDARRALNLLEIVTDLSDEATVSDDVIKEVVAGGVRRFDKGGEVFYDQISALHKSVRGSSADGALYWLARMLDGGCDPLYLARRVVRMASEDIGNADPRALQVCINAWDTVERLGSPEGDLALAQAVLYLAVAPKSNAVYKAFNMAMADVKESGTHEVPLHLRNAPTKLMKELDYGKTYRYAHDEPDAYAAGENYFPDDLEPRSYYAPVPRGLEEKIAAKMQRLRELDTQYDKEK